MITTRKHNLITAVLIGALMATAAHAQTASQ
jgi:hypothetical protein